MNECNLAAAGAPAPEEEAHAGGDGGFCQLEFTDVRLCDHDRPGEGKFLRTVCQPAVGKDCSKVEAGRNRVHQAAAADPARRRIPDHVAFEPAVLENNMGNRAAGGSHTHADRGAFERGTGSGGSTEYPVPVCQNDLAVCAEVDQCAQGLTGRNAGRKNPGEDVAPHKSADTGQKPNPARRRQGPVELGGCENLLVHPVGDKRSVGERQDIEPRKQVVHDGIAREHDFSQFGAALAGQVDRHCADGAAYQWRQARIGKRKQHAAHHIGAVSALRIQRSAQTEHLARGQVEHLCRDRRGADIDGNAEAGAAFALERCAVGEHRRDPLTDLELERRVRPGTARQAPALRQFIFGEHDPVGNPRGKRSVHYANPAAAAHVRTAAREFYAVFGQDIRQRRAPLHFEAHVQGEKLDNHCVTHIRILPH